VVQHLSYEVIQLVRKKPLVTGHELISVFEKKPLHPLLDLHNFNIYMYIIKYWLDQDILKIKIMTYLYFILSIFIYISY